jgi:two-component system, OmpR family, sensor kinase
VSFRTRLLLAAAYLLTAVVLALEIPLALNVEARARSEFESAVLGRAAVLAARVSDLVVRATPPARSASARVADLANGERIADERIVITDRRGRVIADTAGLATRGTQYATMARPELRAALFGGRIDTRNRFSESIGGELLLVTVPVVDQQRVVGAVRVSTPTAAIRDRAHDSWLRLALIGVGVVAVGLALAWVLAGAVSRRVSRLAEAAGRVGSGDLSASVPEEGPRELRSLAASFNRMTRALAANVAAQRDFVANASHQLRTPLTGMRLRLEAIKSEGGAAGEQAAKAELELDRLNELVDDLLALERASSSDADGRTVDLSEISRQAVERWRAPAEEAGQTLRLQADAPARVFADPTDLAHVVDNLIENALRYCPPGTEVSVETRARKSDVALVVADTGPGIPAGDRGRVFERFYRGANGQQKHAGTGLGLAIVSETVIRWGGAVMLLDGPGTQVEATFPKPPTNS